MYPPLSTTNPAWDRQGSPRGRPPMVLMDERLDVVLIHDAIDGVLSDAELASLSSCRARPLGRVVVRAMDELDVHQLVEQLLSLGVRPGGVLLVHTAFSRVRPVEGGPLGLIQALSDALGPEGTLVVPTMTAGDSVFDPRTTPTQDMGVTAERFRRLAGVLRSDHPGASFAARGPRAAEICAPQPLQPPHGPDSPVGRVWRRARSSRGP